MPDAKPDKGTIDHTKQYRVTLAARVQVGRRWLTNRNDNVVRGDVLLEIYDSVESFEPVAG